MAVLFERSRTWCTPGDLPCELLPSFYGKRTDSQDRPPSGSADEQRILHHQAMIISVRSEIAGITQFIPLPYAIVLTDCSGCVLDLLCSAPAFSADMEQAGFGIGSSLSKQESGLNAVSLSMEMNCIGVVKGEEHNHPAFADWNCVCAPLQLDGQTLGYLDISFHKEKQIEFAIPFIRQLAGNISGRWLEHSPELQRHQREMLYTGFALTAREKQVAHLWSLEKSALYISSELGISEGTVKNMVKSIYSKMNVSDRRQFVSRLLK